MYFINFLFRFYAIFFFQGLLNLINLGSKKWYKTICNFFFLCFEITFEAGGKIFLAFIAGVNKIYILENFQNVTFRTFIKSKTNE